MNTVEEICAVWLANIRALAMHHQQNHWITKGYENHLLFERIYNSAAADSDAIAERLVGLFGVEAIDLKIQANLFKTLLNEFSGSDPALRSFEVERKFITLTGRLNDTIEKESAMTLGLTDLIGTVCSHREEAIYLLKQALNKGNIMNEKIAARKSALSKYAQSAEESQAFAEFKRELSSVLTQMVAKDKSGHPANFGVRASRNGSGENTKYVITVVLQERTPEAKYQMQLEQKLQEIVKRVAFFANKNVNTSVELINKL